MEEEQIEIEKQLQDDDYNYDDLDEDLVEDEIIDELEMVEKAKQQ